MSPADPASVARPPWRELLCDGALRRLARLSALRTEDAVLWLGRGGEKAVKVIEKIVPCQAETQGSLAGIEEQSLSLVIAPELASERGLDVALGLLRSLLAPDGVAAVVVRAFVGTEVPEPLRAFWAKKLPEPLRTLKETLSRFSALGFEPLTTELLGEPSLAAHDEQLLAEACGSASGGEALAEAAAGLHHGANLGLFIGRRVEFGAPPRWPRRGLAE